MPMRSAFVVLLATVLGGCANPGGERASTSDTAQFRPLVVGDSMPPLAVRTLAGDTARVGPGGPVALVNVWATWCTSCREEMADLEALHRDFTVRGLRVVAVSVDAGDGARVRRFAEHAGLTMTVAHDPEGRVQALYRVMAVPETYLVGRDGRLLWRQTGGLHGAPAAARSAVDAALGPPPAQTKTTATR